jgi:hypothetical protein
MNARQGAKVNDTQLASMIAASVASAAIVLDPIAIARADEPCAHVVAPTDLPAEWADAVANLRRQIALLSAADCQSMTLLLEPREAGMRMVATTSDGRRTERIVTDPDGLVAVGIGLLMTIPVVPSATPPVPVPSAAPPGPSGLQPPTVVLHTAQDSAPRTIALWAGISAGIRLTAPTSLSVVDVEARTDIFFDRWLMMITLRSAVVSCLGEQGVDCDVYNDVSMGAGIGRRFQTSGPDVDLAFEPSVVVMHMEYDGVAGAEGQTVADTEVALRLDGSARLAVPVDRHWVLTLTLDLGIAPSMLASPTRLELPPGASAGAMPPPPFPAWSGGMRLGLSGALL